MLKLMLFRDSPMVDPITGIVTPSCEAAVQPQGTRWRRYFAALLSIGLSGLLLYLAVRRVDLLEVRKALAGVNLYWLVPITLMSLVSLYLRALRWAWIFPADTRPKVRRIFSASMIGALINNIVPGRLGDLARAGLIGRLVPTIGASGALATVALEKALDGLVVLALLGVAFLLAPLPAWLGRMGVLGAMILTGMLLVLMMLKRSAEAERTILNFAMRRLRLDLATSLLKGRLHRFASGLNVLGSNKQCLNLLALTLTTWLLDMSIIFIAFRVFNLTLPFMAAMVTTVLLAVGMMFPGAPGFIGTYQFFTVTSLQLYAVPAGQALALAIFLNVFTIADTTLIGLIALSAEGISWSRLAHPTIFPAED
jgi:uncharacterized protein (TIRG00374 family)